MKYGSNYKQYCPDFSAESGLRVASAAGGGGDREVREELLSALVNLGYPRAQAERVAEVSAREAGEGASIESLIRVALKRLAR